MTLPDDLDLIAEHIGDDQPNLPPGAKNTLLLAAKALRKLPTTADGVVITPRMTVYYFGRSMQEARRGDPERSVSGVVDMPLLPIVRSCPPEDGIILGRHAVLCHSTPKAAEAAQQKEQDNEN